MYGNYFRGPFVMPNTFTTNVVSNPSIPFVNAAHGGMGLSRGFGASKSGISGIFSGLKKFNWSGMLNNASKTLGVVKEAIPVVKEVRPMISNMKSMIKIASAFNDVTDTNNNVNIKENNMDLSKKETTDIFDNTSSEISNNNEPHFFL